MLIDPYHATITKAHTGINKTANLVVEEMIRRQSDDSVFEVTEEMRDIPMFSQPLLIKKPGDKEFRVAICLKAFRGDNAFLREQKDILRNRAILTLYAANKNDTGRFYHPCAQAAYANLVAGIIAGSAGIDPGLKLQITAAAAAHYYNMTHEGNDAAGYEDRTQLLLVGSISGLLKIPADIVDVVVSQMQYGSTLESLAANIRTVDGTDRTAGFQPGILTQGASGIWFGVDAKETISVAFEHAPTFCAMLHAALGAGSYSRSDFAKRLKYVSATNKNADGFRQLIRTVTVEQLGG